VKRRRNNELLAIQSAVSLADHRQRIGQMVEVLVEGPSKIAQKHESSGPVQLTGRTPTDHIVVFEGNERLIGQTLSVDIKEATAFTLFGTVVTGEHVGGLPRKSTSEIALVPAIPRRFGLPLV
jgi:tRNA-2-methylthio-N6-dimethylallyladenosine synthase